MNLIGPFAAGLGIADNLVLKAAHAFAVATGVTPSARLVLTKSLPIASGIGGGSADAAATLRGLLALYPGTAEAAQLHAIATGIGSDVGACVVSRALFMRGRGERIEVLDGFPALDAVLVNPGLAVSTGKVFARLRGRTGTNASRTPSGLSDTLAVVRYLRGTRNDLEPAAREIVPEIGTVLDEIARMPGIMITRMSGSGATCFGLFESRLEAEMAATALSRSHPAWWIAPTVLR
jgi:4-diphosphocytidyl-2-C-methyl-D-erythritol kinase